VGRGIPRPTVVLTPRVEEMRSDDRERTGEVNLDG
jgi:hypothetical protein